MKTLKCKNCGEVREYLPHYLEARYEGDETVYLVGCPLCRQNVVYSKKELDAHVVDEPANDEIHKPSHYHKGGIDVIGYAEKKFSAEERKGFYRISALKYITRFEDKGQPLKDLKKAKFFVDKLIDFEERRE